MLRFRYHDFYGVCVYYCSTYYKAVRVTMGEGDSGGLGHWHVLRETTSRGLSGLVCPSRTSERGGDGDCVKEGAGGRRGAREGAVFFSQPVNWFNLNAKL